MLCPPVYPSPVPFSGNRWRHQRVLQDFQSRSPDRHPSSNLASDEQKLGAETDCRFEILFVRGLPTRILQCLLRRRKPILRKLSSLFEFLVHQVRCPLQIFLFSHREPYFLSQPVHCFPTLLSFYGNQPRDLTRQPSEIFMEVGG